MHPAYSVIVFTTASGMGYGLLALLGLVGAAHGPASNWWFAATCLAVAFALIGVGLLSSTAHLGHPERAWRALSQWRSSWLSREGVAAIVTFAPGLAFGWAWLDPDADPYLLDILGLATLALSAVTVACTGMIYQSLATIRHWHHPLVTPIYLAFALATGSALLMAIAEIFGRGQVVLSTITAASLVLVLVLKRLWWRAVDRDPGRFTMGDATGLGTLGEVRQWEIPHTAGNFVMNEMGYRIARKHAEKLRRLVAAGLVLALALSLVAFTGIKALAIPAAVVAAATAYAAAFLERWLFFAEARHVVGLYYGAPRA
jgi:DMSO reductase anchor subunit